MVRAYGTIFYYIAPLRRIKIRRYKIDRADGSAISKIATVDFKVWGFEVGMRLL